MRAAAASLAETLASPVAGRQTRSGASSLIRQLRAVVARDRHPARPARAVRRRGARAVRPRRAGRRRTATAAAAVRGEIDRLLPGRGDLAARYAAFDRRFLIAPDRLPAVLSRAIDGCRAATRAHVPLPPAERVDVEYVRELSWSAFTRYQGGFTSRIQVNAGLPLTVDRALDLACHEAYPGHHTIASLLEARFGGRVEFLVQPLFSPQSLLHEAASSLAGVAGVSRTGADGVRARRAVSRWPASTLPRPPVMSASDGWSTSSTAFTPTIARRYLDGEPRFPARRHGARARCPDAVCRCHAEVPESVPHLRGHIHDRPGRSCGGTSTRMRPPDDEASRVARLRGCRRRSGANRAAARRSRR